MDEVVKISSSKSEFGEEILRQSKVELIMLFQNESKLKDKMDSNKYEALIGNLTNIYLMKNKDNFTIGKDEIDCSRLNQFECIHDNTTYLLNPVFINQQERLEAMAEFDSIHKIHRKLLGRSYKNHYLEFDDDLF